VDQVTGEWRRRSEAAGDRMDEQIKTTPFLCSEALQCAVHTHLLQLLKKSSRLRAALH